MVADGWATGVQMDELFALQDCLAALEWMKEVRKYSIITLLQPQTGSRISEPSAATCAAPEQELREPAEAQAASDPTLPPSESKKQQPVSIDWEPADARDFAPPLARTSAESNGRLQLGTWHLYSKLILRYIAKTSSRP